MKRTGPEKVLLLGASFNTRNMGVGALAAGSIKCVRSACPEAELGMLDYAKKGGFINYMLQGRELLIRLVNIRFSKDLFLPNNVALLILLSAICRMLPQGFRRKVISGNETLREIDSASVAASIAGGDSFSSIYGMGRFFYVALPQILVILMGKRLIQLPQTYGPFTNGLSRAIARFILANSSAVYSRDYRGIDEVKALLGADGSSGKIRFCHDVAFVLDPARPEGCSVEGTAFDGAGQASCTVGFNVSGLLYMGGYNRDNMFGLRLDYRRLVPEIIDFLITRKRAQVVLIPHVFGGSEHPESDSEACRKVYESLKSAHGGRLSMVTGTFDQAGIKHVIGRCDFFIGSRMHACIAALSQCVPAVPIAYSRKFIGVMETIGVQDYVADPCTLDAEGVIGVIDKAFEDRAAIADKLKEEMPGVKEGVLRLFKTIDSGAVQQ